MINDGTMTISGASLAGNKAAQGAGIFNSGGVAYSPACDVEKQESRQCAGSLPFAIGSDLLISNSSVGGNIATSEGGGLFNAGTVHLESGAVSAPTWWKEQPKVGRSITAETSV